VARALAQSRRLDAHLRRGASGTENLCRQGGDSEVLMSEEAEACFVLPLRNARSAEAGAPVMSHVTTDCTRTDHDAPAN
jgi:hypothetical protein